MDLIAMWIFIRFLSSVDPLLQFQMLKLLFLFGGTGAPNFKKSFKYQKKCKITHQNCQKSCVDRPTASWRLKVSTIKTWCWIPMCKQMG